MVIVGWMMILMILSPKSITSIGANRSRTDRSSIGHMSMIAVIIIGADGSIVILPIEVIRTSSIRVVSTATNIILIRTFVSKSTTHPVATDSLPVKMTQWRSGGSVVGISVTSFRRWSRRNRAVMIMTNSRIIIVIRTAPSLLTLRMAHDGGVRPQRIVGRRTAAAAAVTRRRSGRMMMMMIWIIIILTISTSPTIRWIISGGRAASPAVVVIGGIHGVDLVFVRRGVRLHRPGCRLGFRNSATRYGFVSL